MSDYRLLKGEKTESGLVRHEALTPGGEGVFRYSSVRIGLVWPGTANPAFFVVGGMETEDELFFSAQGVIRIIEEAEFEDLSLNRLFDAVTSSYTSACAEVIYCDFKLEDYRNRFWEYLDRNNLRNVNSMDVPYKDVILRLSTIKDFNDSGSLLIDKGSLLFQDLQGISRSHLKDSPEERFYRLNGLGYLISGFAKFPPVKRLKDVVRRFGRGDTWMVG